MCTIKLNVNLILYFRLKQWNGSKTPKYTFPNIVVVILSLKWRWLKGVSSFAIYWLAAISDNKEAAWSKNIKRQQGKTTKGSYRIVFLEIRAFKFIRNMSWTEGLSGNVYSCLPLNLQRLSGAQAACMGKCPRLDLFPLLNTEVMNWDFPMFQC